MRIAMGPLTQYRRRYVRHGDGNIAYGSAGRRNKLDVWRRRDLPADTPDGSGAPVLLQVHGGGWVTGNKQQQQAMPLMAHLCDRGWVPVSTVHTAPTCMCHEAVSPYQNAAS